MKLKQIHKATKSLCKKIHKALAEYRKALAKALAMLICGTLTACGSTKVSVSKPAEGTSTTITVTTNNPVSTQVNPTTSAELNLK